LKSYIREKLRASPLAFGAIGRWREHPDFDRRVVRRGDDLVIEGYPRSGNTFGMMAFRLAQPGPLNIGNHFHAPAQILRAARFGIPAMVVIREPMAAALSLVVYYQGRVSPERALEQYVAFHKPLIACTDAYCIAPFKEVVSDYGRSIERLNAKFGTDFTLYENSLVTDAKTMAAIEKKRLKRLEKSGDVVGSLARKTTPSAEKDAWKTKYAKSFDAPNIAPLRAAATALFMSLSDA